MQKHRLVPHPDTPADTVSAVDVELAVAPADDLVLSFIVNGADRLVTPNGIAARRDELWKTTCFECFVRHPGGDAYQEYNFSPSGGWAAYAFDGYRTNMHELPVGVAPEVFCESQPSTNIFVCRVLLSFWNMPWLPDLQLGLSAVIEEQEGHRSYWALAHSPGPPDFHHPDGFAAELASPI